MIDNAYEVFDRTAWREGRAYQGRRLLADETAVAISYNGATHAVLMATPADLDTTDARVVEVTIPGDPDVDPERPGNRRLHR